MLRLSRSLPSLGALPGLVCALVLLSASPWLLPGAARAAGVRTNPKATAAAASSPTTLTLVLPLAANTGGLARFATEVSTPGSKLYRRYRSIAWLAQHFGASGANKTKVVTYLHAHGATDVRLDHTGLFVDATMRAGTARTLFSTPERVTAKRDGGETVAPPQTRVPAALAGAVTGVVGLDTQPVLAAPSLASAAGSGPAAVRTAFSSIGASITAAATAAQAGSGYPTASGTPSGCTKAVAVGGFTPKQYLTAYNYTGLHSGGTRGQGERVALIEVDGFDKSDVNAFARCFGLSAPKIVAFRTDDAVAKEGLPAGGESTLDLEVLDAAAPGLSQIDVYESSQDISSVLRSLTAPLQNAGYKPEVISASLGLCEPQVRAAVGMGAITNTEGALEEAAASGISVLAASGDDGSADCIDSNSPEALPIPELAVNYPASSPWVTAVGGTNMTLTSANLIASEDVWNDAGEEPGAAGGGGNSTLFARPSYQTGVVSTDHRALPDISALADIQPGYDFYCSAHPECVPDASPQPWQAVGGTSAATPLIAGGLALIDQLLREHKRQSLGLVNPLLYDLGTNPTDDPEVFYNVRTGSNDVGPYVQANHHPLGCCSAGPGFNTAAGWGSIDLGGLATAALAAVPGLVNVSESLPANQKPVSAGAIYDTVTCTGACQIGAFAKITIADAKPLTFYSGISHLSAAGSKLIKISLSRAELARLRTGLDKHERMTAAVVGAIVDPAGNIERQTATASLSITQ